MGVDINQGASQIATLLQPEQPSNSEETAQIEPESIETEVEEVEETEVEALEPSVESEAEETPEGDTEPEELKYTVKVNGEEREVPLDDLKKGYMMEADYRRKTSEVARDRDQVRLKEHDLTSKLEEADKMLKLELEDLKSEENLELKEYDPKAYYEKREALEAKSKRLEELKNDDLKNRDTRKLERVNQEKELLLQNLPEWLDESTLTKEAGLVNQMWADMGFSNEELDVFTDHKLVMISRKAALYDAMMKAKPSAKKVVNKPKSAKPGTTKTSEERTKAKSQDARGRLRKTGNLGDAQAAIKSLLRK